MFEPLTDNWAGRVLIIVAVLVVITMIITAVLFVRLVTKFRPVHDQLTPLGAKVAFWGAVVYTVFPADLLPDPILLIDDIGVLVGALYYISRVLSDDAPGLRSGRDDGHEEGS